MGEGIACGDADDDDGISVDVFARGAGMNEITFKTLLNVWRVYAIRLLMTIPEDGLAQLEGREVRKKRVNTWVLWFMIGGLAIASITNLASRASSHKPGIAANAAGMFIALLVPVVVHYAIKMDGKERIGVWAIALGTAAFSGIIQYQIYAPPEYVVWWSKDNLEALAFGAGVPLAECALAAIAAVVVKRELEQEEEEKAMTIEGKEAERERQRLERERDQQFALDLDLKRKREEAKINKKYGVQDSVQSVQNSVQIEQSTPVNEQSKNEQLNTILNMLRDGQVSPTNNAKALGVSRGTYYNRLNDLEDAGLIHRNGNGLEVL